MGLRKFVVEWFKDGKFWICSEHKTFNEAYDAIYNYAVKMIMCGESRWHSVASAMKEFSLSNELPGVAKLHTYTIK